MIATVFWREGGGLVAADVLRFDDDVLPPEAIETTRDLFPAADYPEVAFIIYSSASSSSR